MDFVCSIDGWGFFGLGFFALIWVFWVGGWFDFGVYFGFVLEIS